MSDIPVTPKKLKQIVNDIVPSQQYTEEMQRRQAIDKFNAQVAGQIDDYKALIVAAGFNTVPWVRPIRWRHDEDPELMHYYPAQELAALQIFYMMFVIEDKKAWVHLSAEMQSGKTGVINALIRLVKANEGCQITDDSIFVTTGMSDKAWLMQTKDRLIWDIRENVKHNGTLKKIEPTLSALYKRHSREGTLKNILIVIDESHIAAAKNNRPFKEVFDVVNSLCDGHQEDNNIKYITVSATDPAAVIAAYKAEGAGSVRLRNSPEYLSVQQLYKMGHIMKVKDLAIETHMRELYTFIKSNPSLHKKYIIIRAKGKSKGLDRSSAIKCHIEKMFDEFRPDITFWDDKSPRPERKETSDDGSTTSTKMKDINELLSSEPDTLHFILIKDMFYAAKTVDTSNIGILYDNYSEGQKHDTALQSLLGRACGYNKNGDVYIFSNIKAVETYIEVWRDFEDKLSETPGGNIIIDGVDADTIRGKMNSLGAKTIDGEVAAKLDKNRAVPLSHLIDPDALTPVDGRMTVPVVINFTKEFIQELITSKSRGALLIEKLRVHRESYKPHLPKITKLIKTLMDYELYQFAVATSDANYKKHVLDLVRKATANQPASIGLSDAQRSKKKNNWQAFIDDRENRVVITIWHGTKSAH